MLDVVTVVDDGDDGRRAPQGVILAVLSQLLKAFGTTYFLRVTLFLTYFLTCYLAFAFYLIYFLEFFLAFYLVYLRGFFVNEVRWATL